MTQETLLFLQSLLDGVQIHVGHPDFERQVALIINAKRELAAAVAED